MNLSVFSLNTIFRRKAWRTPMLFGISVAAELVFFALAKNPRTASPSQDCPAPAGPWDTLNAKAPLAKIVIRSKTDRFIFIPITFYHKNLFNPYC
ncbi:MAG: hypothetical protein WDL87_04020 [Candidatus Omnitrophota bacterium]|jgi:hypothetical protein